VENREILEGSERGGIPNRNILWHRKNSRFEPNRTYQIAAKEVKQYLHMSG
jgi:hypothetical protein